MGACPRLPLPRLCSRRFASVAVSVRVCSAPAFSRGGSFLVSGSSGDSPCRIWIVKGSSQARALLHDAQDHIHSVSISPDDKTIACGSKKELILWSVEDLSHPHRLKTLTVEGDVFGLDFSPGGHTLAVGCRLDSGSWIGLWDVGTGEWVGEREEIRGEVIHGLQFSPDGSQLVSSHGRGTVRSWDVGVMRTIAGPGSNDSNGRSSSRVLAVAFSPLDAYQLAVVAEDGTVELWDVPSRKIVCEMAHPDPTTLNPRYVTLTWSPDVAHLALTGHTDHSVVVYDMAQASSTSILSGHSKDVLPVVFTSNSQHVVTGSYDGSIRLYDAVAESEEVLFDRPECGIWAIAASPCDSCLLFSMIDPGTSRTPGSANAQEVESAHPLMSASFGGYSTMHLYDLTSKTVVTEVYHRHAIVALSFSSNGSRVVGSSERGQISLWEFSPPHHSGVDTTREYPDRTPEPSRGTLRLLAELHPETSGISVERIRFSADERAVITNACFVLITSEAHWPLVAQHDAVSQPGPIYIESHPNPDYFLSNGWIQCGCHGEDPQRARWLPPVYRYRPAKVGYQRRPGGWNTRGEWVAFATNEGRLVVMDLSGGPEQSSSQT